ncbi:hypothetical protein [Rhodanobacter sp. C03]|uniref:hypothetical protein n=1 Tax=Rhodanobacter sp. C03 TaxID=1945858 RepID=UPI001C2C671A|nr:hypothetical protein [Rhodanobacter sp. C03]
MHIIQCGGSCRGRRQSQCHLQNATFAQECLSTRHGGDRDDAGDIVATECCQRGKRGAQANADEYEPICTRAKRELAGIVDACQPPIDPVGIEIVASTVAAAIEIDTHCRNSRMCSSFGKMTH